MGCCCAKGQNDEVYSDEGSNERAALGSSTSQSAPGRKLTFNNSPSSAIGDANISATRRVRFVSATSLARLSSIPHYVRLFPGGCFP